MFNPRASCEMNYTKPNFCTVVVSSWKFPNLQQFCEDVGISKMTSSFYIDLFNDFRKAASLLLLKSPNKILLFVHK